MTAQQSQNVKINNRTVGATPHDGGARAPLSQYIPAPKRLVSQLKADKALENMLVDAVRKKHKSTIPHFNTARYECVDPGARCCFCFYSRKLALNV